MSRRQQGNSAPISLFSFQDLITSLSGILILLVLLMAVQIAISKTIPAASDNETETIPDLDGIKMSIASLKRQLGALRQALNAGSSVDAVAAVEQTVAAERVRSELSKELTRMNGWKESLESRLAVVKEMAERQESENRPMKAELDQLQAALERAVRESKVFYIPEKGDPKTPVLVECSGTAIRVGFISRPVAPVVFGTDKTGIRGFIRQLGEYSPTREYLVFMVKPSSLGYWEQLKEAAASRNFDMGYDALEEDKTIGFGNERP